jgi:hypothetical protein
VGAELEQKHSCAHRVDNTMPICRSKFCVYAHCVATLMLVVHFIITRSVWSSLRDICRLNGLYFLIFITLAIDHSVCSTAIASWPPGRRLAGNTIHSHTIAMVVQSSPQEWLIFQAFSQCPGRSHSRSLRSTACVHHGPDYDFGLGCRSCH